MKSTQLLYPILSISKVMTTVIAFFCLQLGFAQDASFEGDVPSNYKAKLGTLSTSEQHYKLGKKSLQWNWSANDELVVSDLQNNGLVASEVLGYYENMFRLWIYNTEKISPENLVIEFYDTKGNLQFYCDFYVNFTGWRAASASYKFEMSGAKASTDLSTMKIKAPKNGNGTFYLDFIDFTMARNRDRAPDYQMPWIAQSGKHWDDMMYFQSLPKAVTKTAPTSQELADLNKIKTRYYNLILGNNPSSSKLSTALKKYNAQEIEYENGIVTGKPIYGADFYDTENIDVVDEFIMVFAQDYKHDATVSSLNYYLNTIRYLLDQGFADGSLVETVHHIGYRCRNVIKSVHLMKDELQAAELWEEARKMAEWYTAIDIIWHPNAHDSNVDDGVTRMVTTLGACLNLPTESEQVQYLKGFKKYVETWFTPYAKEGEGLKVDFTGFHHNVYYPQYIFGAYKNTAEAVQLISDTNYEITSEKRDFFKKMLLTARVVMSKDNFANSMSGRSPLNSISLDKAYKKLGLAGEVDTQLLQIYNYVEGGDSDTNAYGKETPPTGFFQVNFSNLGAYRQDDWVVDVKGFNKYFWGTEIYGSDNRYGRYQSYGAVEVMYKGGHSKSGFNINGWNWNMPPGTTTIHLSWEDLKASKSRQDEATGSNFAAHVRFGKKSSYYLDPKMEGTIGLFGMDFQQGENSNSHNDSFKFKKSVFFIDGKIICLGSNIENDDTSNTTATNLFQNYLNTTSKEIHINNVFNNQFPSSKKVNQTNTTLLDAYNTGYFVKNGNLVIERKQQESPHENGKGSSTTGNFSSAFIDHGTNPKNASYEYVILPKTTSTSLEQFKTEMSNEATRFYEVIQQNETAHIIQKEGFTGYVLFKNATYNHENLLLKSNSAPCLMISKEHGNKLDLSVVNPDLNFTGSDGTSNPTEITLKLNGTWELNSFSGGATSVVLDGNRTILKVSPKEGFPVDVSLTAVVENTFYPIFCYEDFRDIESHGVRVHVVKDGGQELSKLGKVILDVVGATPNSEDDANGKFVDERPLERIPNGAIRDQRAISIAGASNNTNYETEVFLLFDPVNLSDSNPFIDSNDSHKYLSFWTQSRYANGGTSKLTLLYSKSYVKGANPEMYTWKDVTPDVNQIAANNDADDTLYLNSVLDISNYDASNATFALKYESTDVSYSSAQRNGIFYISDVKFFTSKESLEQPNQPVKNDVKMYPNPVSDTLKFGRLIAEKEIKKVQFFNSSGSLCKEVLFSEEIEVKDLSSGLYFVKVLIEGGTSYVNKIMVSH